MENKKILIGLSLSKCIKHILMETRKIEDISLLVTSTKCQSEDDWKRIFDAYSKTYWKSDTQQGAQALTILLATQRIWQPRIHGLQAPMTYDHVYWINSFSALDDKMNIKKT